MFDESPSEWSSCFFIRPSCGGRAEYAPAVTDTLIRNASQVVTMASGGRPKRGRDLADPGVLEHGAVLIRDRRIEAVGTDADLAPRATGADTIDAEGGIVTPGFVDPHTHLVFAGSRPAEFEARLAQGRSFTDFIKTGGGAMDTVRATRAASDDELEGLVLLRLQRIAGLGTTTAEVKTGYGLTIDEELRHLRLLKRLAPRSPIRVVPTALPAHFRPPDPGASVDEYLDRICDEIIPTAARDGLATSVDVFHDPTAYSAEQVRRIISTATAHGLGGRIHADQLVDDGGAALAVELGCLSADHLGHISDDGISAMARSDTVGVLIPGSLFFVPGEKAAPVREMIDRGVALALSTDYTPGTSPVVAMQTALTLAMVLLRMSAAEVLAASTINAAFALGLGTETGSIEPGKQADLVIHEARDYRELPYRVGENLVRRVIVGGRTIVERPPVGPL
jgi:imidazolonepropionase